MGTAMGQVIGIIVLVALIGYAAFKVRNGTWYGTWAGSGMKPNGPRFPGAPHHDPGR